MAIKPTIYRLTLSLSDLDRDIFESHNLTLARHPSETMERMMVRVLAFCLNASERLAFCKGLSDTEEPDLWAHSLDGNLELWIDVGEPSFERVKKSSRLSKSLRVYCFNSKAPTWWQQNQAQLSKLPAEIFRFDWAQVTALAAICDRGAELSVTLSGDSVYVATELGESELRLETLQGSA